MLFNYKSNLTRPLMASAMGLLLVASPVSMADAKPEEAERLKGELTPLGAIRAGNAEGTIPEWNGGLTDFSPVVKDGRRLDPFEGEKPLFSITAQNMDEHADKLTDGVKAMFNKYPDTYRMDVYKTHRTMAAPEWVYDNTFENATSAELVPADDGGVRPEGAYGGIPFPIPQNGAEVIWNHLLHWKGQALEGRFHGVLGTEDGDHVLTVDGVIEENFPFYFYDGSVDSHNGETWSIRLRNEGPPIRAGEGIVGNMIWGDVETYVYLTGQRRTRKLPESCCDTPTPATAGVQSFDEIRVFSGTLKRFDWEILGKKEIYIPYNSNRILVPDSNEDVMDEHHLNPDYVRWELHRVWAVQATVKDGQRHQAPKSIYYLDEDSWNAVLGDRWDEQGNLWKTLWGISVVQPDIPTTAVMTNGFYDLVSGSWYANNLYNEPNVQSLPVDPFPARIFTPAGLKSRSLR